MTYPIQPGSPFRAAEIGEAAKHTIFAERLGSVQTSTVCSPIEAAAAAAASWHHEENSLMHWTPVYF